jgi:hypothetical protein
VDSSSAFCATIPRPAGTTDVCIAVAHPSFSKPLTLTRLDRHGLVFRASAALPIIDGLPHDATLRADDEALCSLRLVIRDAARSDDGRYDVTMQPSCTASDELLWRTLHDRQWYGRLARPLAPMPDAPMPGGASPAGAEPICRVENTMRLTRSAAFRLTCRGDALFFSDWLEYHFDEFHALAQQCARQLQLNRIERQLTDDTVGIRFVYDIDGHATQHELDDCARAACMWIEDEMHDKYALPLAQEWIDAYRLCGVAGH